MADYTHIFPTKWPLLEFSIRIWKFSIVSVLFAPGDTTTTYEYVRCAMFWAGKSLFHFRIYDTYKRKNDKLRELMSKVYNYKIEELKKIRDIAIEEIEKLEK